MPILNIPLITSLLRVLSNRLLDMGGLSAEAHAAVHIIAAEADGHNSGAARRQTRLSPLRFCRRCGAWVQDPCDPEPW